MSEGADIVKFERKGSVVVITLNDPDNMNAINANIFNRLLERLYDARNDETVRVIVLTGAGRAFCAGGNLKQATEDSPEKLGNSFYKLAPGLSLIITELRKIPRPIIAALNGPAAGGGFSLALACDMRVMSDKAFLRQAYTSNGLCPDGGGTYHLPKLVGLAKALEIAFLDDVISPAKALELGLVTKVAPHDKLMEETMALAKTLAERPVGVLGATKRLLNDSFSNSFETQLELERSAIGDCANSDEGIEGVNAFIEKRTPDFTK